MKNKRRTEFQDEEKPNPEALEPYASDNRSPPNNGSGDSTRKTEMRKMSKQGLWRQSRT